jgi:phosphoribosylformylglycinamidine synthase subunit PurQ / glutaminase
MSTHAVPAVVLAAPGTNRDVDVAAALELAGASARIIPLAEVNAASLADARMAVVAGGFSFADALGSGRLFALELADRLGDSLHEFIAAGRPVLGICNGFQTLVRAGILPGPTGRAALGHNAHGRFECRWVTLEADTASTSIWTAGITAPILCPVAHGEGRFHTDADTLVALRANGQIALRYRRADGSDANGSFPANPNGSDDDIAGVCDLTGVVLGLMPHPEDHVLNRHHPRWTRGESTGSCQPLFANGVRHAKEL